MKKGAVIIFIVTFNLVKAQNFIDTTTYALPINSKFILDMVQIDSVNYKYHVIDMQPFNKTVNYAQTDALFSVSPIPGTLECYFVKGHDPEGPFKSVLLIKNNSTIILNYSALIDYMGHEGFYETSIHALIPGVQSSELWNDHLDAIVLHKFMRLK